MYIGIKTTDIIKSKCPFLKIKKFRRNLENSNIIITIENEINLDRNFQGFLSIFTIPTERSKLELLIYYPR